MTPNEQAAERLRAFTAEWSEPEKLLVEQIIADLGGQPRIIALTPSEPAEPVDTDSEQAVA